jgi:DmsE family decaheme c-type cytochrome
LRNSIIAESRRRFGTATGFAAGTMLTLLLVTALLPSDSVSQNARGNSDAQYTAEGAERCLLCHAAPQMRIIARTVHGNTDNPFTPYSKQGCEACHGPGSLHVSRARGGIGFPEMLSFSADESPQRKAAACLSCHANDMGELDGMQWEGSIHAVAGNTCTNCHEIHAVGNPLTEREAQVTICSDCHSAQIANHRRFEDVGIIFDELKCYNCHDVHQMVREQ